MLAKCRKLAKRATCKESIKGGTQVVCGLTSLASVDSKVLLAYGYYCMSASFSKCIELRICS